MGHTNKYGTTSSSIAFATNLAIRHNIKVLLVSTSLNDNLMQESFWPERKKSTFSLFGGKAGAGALETSGIVGLDRMLRANKLTPDIITDYAKIVLTNRLEILLGVEKDQEQYDQIKQKYAQIITMAGKYYDMVIVDLDKKLGSKVTMEILNASDVVITLVSQRAKDIENIQKMIKTGPALNERNTIMAIGKYMDLSKYNAKNITRNLLRRKELINTIPYNNLFFESSQEGTVIDLFLNFMRLKEKDTNYNFIYELNRLNDVIKERIKELQTIQ